MAEFHSDTPNVLLFEAMPFAPLTMTAMVTKGPNEYKYPPYTFTFRSHCDLYLRSSVNVTLEWMEPCSQVEFGGVLAREGSFTVNLETK